MRVRSLRRIRGGCLFISSSLVWPSMSSSSEIYLFEMIPRHRDSTRGEMCTTSIGSCVRAGSAFSALGSGREDNKQG